MEPKYKRGDKCVVTGNTIAHQFPIGALVIIVDEGITHLKYTITYLCANYPDRTIYWTCKEDELEYPEAIISAVRSLAHPVHIDTIITDNLDNLFEGEVKKQKT